MMTKILLADDERMVRIAMESMLLDLYPGCLQIIHAEDGRRMMELAQQEQPQIAFVDIRMPQLDGLAALKECRGLSPDTQWIIVTGYAEFEYAQRALRLGAREYLLKPVSFPELQTLMEELSDDGRIRLEKQNDLFSLRTILAFNELQTIEDAVISNDLGEYRIYLFHPDGVDGPEHARALCKLSETVSAIGSSALHYHCRHALFYLASGELCLVTCGESRDCPLSPQIAHAARCLPVPVTTHTLGGGSLREIYSGCLRLLGLSPLRAVHRFGSLVDWDREPPVRKPLARLASLLEESCLAFATKNEVAYGDALSSLGSFAMQEAYREADPASVGKYMACYLGEVDASTHGSLLQSLQGKRADMFRVRPAGPRDTVADVRRYVEEHYREQIGLNTIAELYNITPNYLSKLFHERTGEKFINYLTEVRISNAKRLLTAHPELTVKAVAEQVGYLSTRYFTKTFYKKVGKLPSEYYESQQTAGIR